MSLKEQIEAWKCDNNNVHPYDSTDRPTGEAGYANTHTEIIETYCYVDLKIYHCIYQGDLGFHCVASVLGHTKEEFLSGTSEEIRILALSIGFDLVEEILKSVGGEEPMPTTWRTEINRLYNI